MKNNYIKKDVSLKNISPKYKKIITNVKNNLLNYSDKIYSIYLYGSVVTGKAKSPTSDLDIIIILKRKPTKKFREELNEIENKLSKKYNKIFREIGFAVTYVNEVTLLKGSYGRKFFLTILGVKIYGDNPLQKQMNFSPTNKLAKNLHSDIAINIKSAKNKIKSANSHVSKLETQSIMKKIIRTAFSIVMERENYWTTDLDEMSKIVIKYYPEKRIEINEVLAIAKGKISNKENSILILDSLGKWVSEEFFKIIFKI